MPIVARLLNSLVKYFQKKRRKNKKGKSRTSKPGAKRRHRKRSRRRRIVKPLKRAAIQKSGFKKPRKKATTPKIKKIHRVPVKKADKIETRAGTPPARVNEVRVGEITHYFSRIQVVVLKITAGKLCVGENIRIQGKGTDFAQKVQSLQIESVDVKSAKKGQLVGLKVLKKARPGDRVYKIK